MPAALIDLTILGATLPGVVTELNHWMKLKSERCPLHPKIVIRKDDYSCSCGCNCEGCSCYKLQR